MNRARLERAMVFAELVEANLTLRPEVKTACPKRGPHWPPES